MRSHSVTCHPAEVTFPPLPQPKLVLDLATPEGCKAELTWVVVISQDSLPAKYGHPLGPLMQLYVSEPITGVFHVMCYINPRFTLHYKWKVAYQTKLMTTSYTLSIHYRYAAWTSLRPPSWTKTLMISRSTGSSTSAATFFSHFFSITALTLVFCAIGDMTSYYLAD